MIPVQFLFGSVQEIRQYGQSRERKLETEKLGNEVNGEMKRGNWETKKLGNQ